MTIMVTIVTCALLASAFVNPAFVSSSSQHLLNDQYAGWIFFAKASCFKDNNFGLYGH